jgi:parallel beta-helix repeat protein
MRTLLTAALLLLPGAASVASLMPAPAATPPPATDQADIVGGACVDLPAWVDECGDTMSGDLGFGPGKGPAFATGRLTGDVPGLAYAGARVCLAGLPAAGCGDVTGVYPQAGQGLSLGGGSGDVYMALDQGCAPEQELRRTGAGWACAPDASAAADVRAFGAKCDGTADDTAALQRALDTALDVFLPPGPGCLTSATLHLDRSGVRLTGAGPASVLRAAAATYDVLELGGGARGVELADFRVLGAATGDTTRQFAVFTRAPGVPAEVRIHGLAIAGEASRGVNSGIKIDTGGRDWLIQGCSFEHLLGVTDGTGYGVLMGQATGNIVSGNSFLGSRGQGRHAVYISAGATANLLASNEVDNFAEAAFPVNTYEWQPPSQFNHIAGNVIRNTPTSSTTGSAAIELYGRTSHNSVVGNLIVSPSVHGIILEDGGRGGTNEGNSVRDNKVYQAGQAGIFLEGAKDADISGNTVFNASQSSPGTYSGIRVESFRFTMPSVADGNRIVGNVVSGSAQRFAIHIDDSNPASANTVILGNAAGAGVLGTIRVEPGATALAAGNTEGLVTSVAFDGLRVGAGSLDFAASLASVPGSGSAATLGGTGGPGPASATQARWIAVKVDGTTYFLPAWR